ncbi:MAG: class I SAM-dependent rRNA methyltransferase [Tidjanibacter sp.]|nr:class I SAM-dependent rRNA methyltransferase [Tidjanibacter sp.]
MSNKRIYLKRGKEESLLRRHPWIFSGAIARADGDPEEGEVVDVFTSQDNFIARGHCQIGSIAVRVLTFEQSEAIDSAWWQSRIGEALSVRKAMGLAESTQTTCYRLVHGEGDGLPGLVIDIYGTTAVVQCHSVGMYLSRNEIAEALRANFGSRLTAIYDKSSQTLPYNADLGAVDGYLWGGASEGDGEVLENGNRFHVDWVKGQKTGFFIDQRENRALVGHYAHGRRLLNTFCYTGGFSIYGLAGGAKEVVSVDSSELAVSLTDKNVALNFGDKAPHRSAAMDTFDFLSTTRKGEFDMIILDPLAFAKHHKVLGNALQGYKRLNARALEKIAPGGILFTFSCSQAVSKEQFRTTVFSAAAIAGRRVRILHQLTQPADHPINIYHPEGEYLKGLVLFVE